MNTRLRQLLAHALAVAVVLGLLGESFATGVTQDLLVRIPATQPAVLSGHLKLGGKNPQGVEINATSRYLTRGGRPWLPVMGEFHFSRYAAAQWEDELLKMKAGGIQVVAT